MYSLPLLVHGLQSSDFQWRVRTPICVMSNTPWVLIVSVRCSNLPGWTWTRPGQSLCPWQEWTILDLRTIRGHMWAYGRGYEHLVFIETEEGWRPVVNSWTNGSRISMVHRISVKGQYSTRYAAKLLVMNAVAPKPVSSSPIRLPVFTNRTWWWINLLLVVDLVIVLFNLAQCGSTVAV